MIRLIQEQKCHIHKNSSNCSSFLYIPRPCVAGPCRQCNQRIADEAILTELYRDLVSRGHAGSAIRELLTKQFLLIDLIVVYFFDIFDFGCSILHE